MTLPLQHLNMVIFENTYYKPFVTSQDCTVDLVLEYLNSNYGIKNNIGLFIQDPDFEPESYNNKVYNQTEKYFLYYDVSQINYFVERD